MPVCGGYSGSHTDVQTVVSLIQGQAGLWQDMLQKVQAGNDDKVTITEYTTQVVAGMNYKIKGRNETQGKNFEVVIYKPLPHTQQPMSISSAHLV